MSKELKPSFSNHVRPATHADFDKWAKSAIVATHIDENTKGKRELCENGRTYILARTSPENLQVVAVVVKEKVRQAAAESSRVTSIGNLSK